MHITQTKTRTLHRLKSAHKTCLNLRIIQHKTAHKTHTDLHIRYAQSGHRRRAKNDRGQFNLKKQMGKCNTYMYVYVQ